VLSRHRFLGKQNKINKKKKNKRRPRRGRQRGTADPDGWGVATPLFGSEGDEVPVQPVTFLKQPRDGAGPRGAGGTTLYGEGNKASRPRREIWADG